MTIASTGGRFQDVYCDTIHEVFAEIRRRRSSPDAEGLVTRFEESRYGGYRVYSMDAEFFVDELVDPIQPQVRRRSFSSSRKAFR